MKSLNQLRRKLEKLELEGEELKILNEEHNAVSAFKENVVHAIGD